MTIFASAKYNAECFRGLHREARSFQSPSFSIYDITDNCWQIFASFSHLQPGMLVGGEARPVQRAASMTGAAAADTPTSDSGFSFLGKSNKGSAFDFVQEEMRASKSK